MARWLSSWYEGLRADNGEIHMEMDASKEAHLSFAWVVRRADREETCQVQVRCDNAKERGVPLPPSVYCTITELEQIADKEASKQQFALCKKERRDDIYVQCRRAS